MKSNHKPLIVAVFLVLLGLGLRVYSFSDSGANAIEVSNLSNGSESFPSLARSQILIGVAEGAQMADSAALTQNVTAITGLTANSDSQPPILDNGVAIQDPGQPIGPTTNGVGAVQYIIKKGDTLSGVAAHFHVSANSIVGANPNIRKKTLQVGATITIPGIVGASSIAASTQATNNATLPNFNGYFIMPAEGYNQAVLQSDNSINIENSCGTPVIAAADGVVVPDNNIINTAGGWNDGYGTFILVEQNFGNKLFTRYTHLQQTLVSVGDYVKQGQEIGLMGQTGSARACSLSFEVIGARNPFGR